MPGSSTTPALAAVIAGAIVFEAARSKRSLMDTFLGKPAQAMSSADRVSTVGQSAANSVTAAVSKATADIKKLLPWTAPSGGAHGFKGPSAPLLNHLAGVAQDVYHLTITATTNGGHVSTSYHYQGRAFDASGSAANMVAFSSYCYHRAPLLLELIHNGGNHGRGFGVKNHVPVNGASVFSAVWADHANHVHVAA